MNASRSAIASIIAESQGEGQAVLYDRAVYGRGAGWQVALAAGLVVVGALVAGPGTASAPARPPAHNAGASGQESLPSPPGFKLKSSNGYTITVAFFRRSANSSTALALIFVRGRVGSVAYFAPASATANAVEANLGELGRIAATFHATGGTRRERPACGKHQAFSFASGYYEGTVDFHGEEGYTDVEASRAEGDAKMALDVICSANSSSGTGPGLPGAELRVHGAQGSSAPSLTVVENDPRAPVQIEVNLSEQRGEIGIERSVRMKASREAFDYDAKLRTATLNPPSPFSGTAVFRRTNRRTSRWKGDLTVDLPGRSGVSLIDGGLHANLFRARFKGSGPLE